MTDLVLVRHGETVWHAENRYAGLTDVPLTEEGHRQAAALADWAKSAGLAAVWSSPLSRARRTAEPAAAACGLTPQLDERFRELDFGEGDGLTRAEMRESFPERLDAFLADPVGHHLPGGEDPRLAVERATAALHDIACSHPEGRVLVAAHSTLVRLVLCHLLGIRLADYRRVFPELHNGTLTELRLAAPGQTSGAAAGGAALIRFNAPTLPS